MWSSKNFIDKFHDPSVNIYRYIFISNYRQIIVVGKNCDLVFFFLFFSSSSSPPRRTSSIAIVTFTLIVVTFVSSSSFFIFFLSSSVTSSNSGTHRCHTFSWSSHFCVATKPLPPSLLHLFCCHLLRPPPPPHLLLLLFFLPIFH